MSSKFRPCSAQRIEQRRLCAWSLLCGVLLCGAMAVPYYLGRIYTSDDLWAYHLPVRQFYAQCLANGDTFDWMPSLYSGFYLTGEGQAGTYHPLHWLLYRFLPLRAAFDLELLLSYPFLLAGTYFFLRRHVRTAAAMFGALVFTFSGFNLLHFVHPNAVAVVAHIPWLLLAINVAVGAASRAAPDEPRASARPVPLGTRDLLGCAGTRARLIWAEASIALLTASQLLLGYPQYVWFSLLAEGTYALLLWRARANRLRRAGGVQKRCQEPLLPQVRWKCSRGIATKVPDTFFAFFGLGRSLWLRLAALKFLGLLIGAVQVLPTFDALRESDRQLAGGDFAHQGALHVLNVLQFIGPYLFRDRVVGGNTHEFGLYLGAVPVALLAWLLVRGKALRGNRPFVAAALCCAGLALWLALGRAGVLYNLQTYLPVIGKFRLPARYLVLVHLALAAAVAVAFADLARSAKRSRGAWQTPRLGPLWRLTALGVLIAVAAGWLWGGEHVQSWPLRLVGPVLLVAATFLISRAAQGVRWALPALIVLTAVDLGVYGCSYAIWPNTYSLETAMSTIPDSHGGRIATELRDPSQPALRVGNQMVLKGWRQLDGYAGLEPARRLDYRDVNSLRVAGVERVLRSKATESIPGLRPLDDRWLAVPNPMPRACIVEHDDVRGTGNPRREIPRTAIETTAFVERTPTTPFADSLGWVAPKVELIFDRPGHIGLLGESGHLDLLVLSERYHPGWRATVNGLPVEIVRTNGEFLGCIVAPLHFIAEFRFQPASLWYGKWMTAVGLILLLNYCVLRGLRSSRSSRSQAPPGNALLARLRLAIRSLARRATPRGRASDALRSQAEPGNDGVHLKARP